MYVLFHLKIQVMADTVSKGESSLKVSVPCSVPSAPVKVTNALQSCRNIWPLTATKSCFSEGQAFTSCICIAPVLGWACNGAWDQTWDWKSGRNLTSLSQAPVVLFSWFFFFFWFGLGFLFVLWFCLFGIFLLVLFLEKRGGNYNFRVQVNVSSDGCIRGTSIIKQPDSPGALDAIRKRED